MPLGDVDALDAWVDSENPSDRLWRQVAEWVFGLSKSPWQHPSVPELSIPGEPTEIRSAKIQDEWSSDVIEVIYANRHGDGLVSLVSIAQQDRPASP